MGSSEAVLRSSWPCETVSAEPRPSLMEYDAIKLFIETSTNIAILLWTERTPLVIKICQRLDGIPLCWSWQRHVSGDGRLSNC
jgi:predicted ATPase